MYKPNNSVDQPLKYLLKLCGLVGVVEIHPQTIGRKIHLTIVIMVHIFSNIYLIVGKVLKTTNDFSFLLSFPDQLSALFLTMSCIASTICSGIMFPTELVQISMNFGIFDKNFEQRSTNKATLIMILGSFFEISLLVFAESYIWLNFVGFGLYKHYLGRNLQILAMRLSMCLLYFLTTGISKRFESVRKHLEKTFNKLNESTENDSRRFISTDNDLLREVKHIFKLHNLLCNTTEMLNKLYGFSLLFDTLFTIGFCILQTCLFINYFFSNVEVASGIYGTRLRVMPLIWLMECFVSLLIHIFMSLENNFRLLIIKFVTYNNWALQNLFISCFHYSYR